MSEHPTDLTRRSDLTIFAGFITAQLPELHSVEAGRMIEMIDLYLGAARDRVAPPSGAQPDVVKMLGEPDLAVTVNPDGSCSPLPRSTEPEAASDVLRKPLNGRLVPCTLPEFIDWTNGLADVVKHRSDHEAWLTVLLVNIAQSMAARASSPPEKEK